MSKSNSLGDICRVIVMFIASSIENLFGGYDGIFFTLIVFVSVDYITGICSAFIQKNLSSRKGAIGLIKKFGILCVIAITTLIEKNILHPLAESVEDQVVDAIMAAKLHTCLKLLLPEERNLIMAIFFEGKSERKLSQEISVPQKTINDRKRKILRKLKKLMENSK